MMESCVQMCPKHRKIIQISSWKNQSNRWCQCSWDTISQLQSFVTKDLIIRHNPTLLLSHSQKAGERMDATSERFVSEYKISSSKQRQCFLKDALYNFKASNGRQVHVLSHPVYQVNLVARRLWTILLLCVCVCVCVCMCMRTCACGFVGWWECVRMCVCVYACVWECVYMRACMCVWWACMYTVPMYVQYTQSFWGQWNSDNCYVVS